MKLHAYTLFYMLLISLTCIAENNTVQQTDDAFDKTIYNWTRTFAEAIEKTKERHYNVHDPEDCMIKAIDGFLSCFDKHSSFLDPKTYKLIIDSTSGEFFGVGIVIDNTRQTKDKSLTVIEVIPGGPAEKAGIRSMDQIVEVDGKILEGMTTEEATARLKGPKNSKVMIKVIRDKNQTIIPIEVTRDLIKEQNTLAFHLENENICYLLLNTFSENSNKQLEQLLKRFKEKPYKALILDLRNNLGGLLHVAIDIVGMFVEKNTHVVSSRDKDNLETARYATTRNRVVQEMPPIFILINNYTASAAEILAGALKIYSEEHFTQLPVFIVGTKSHGKGSVQEVIPISNNCALKITTSLYYFSDGTTIQGTGIEPDFSIERLLPQTEQTEWYLKHYGYESSSKNYIKPHGTPEKPNEDAEKKAEDAPLKNWSIRMQENLQQDTQLRATINLINIFYLGKTDCKIPMNSRKDALTFMKKHFIGHEKIAFTEIK